MNWREWDFKRARRRLWFWLGLQERCGDKKQPDKRFGENGQSFYLQRDIKYGRQKNELTPAPQQELHLEKVDRSGFSTKHFLLSSRSCEGTRPIVSPSWCLACHQLGSEELTTCTQMSRYTGHSLVLARLDTWLLYLQDITIFERKTYFRTRQESVFMGIITEQAPNIILKAYFDFKLM